MLVVTGALVLLSIPALFGRRISFLQPSTAVRLVRACLLSGLVLLVAGLLVVIVPTLIEGRGAHNLLGMCRRIIHDLLSGGHVGGALALFALFLLVARAGFGVWERLVARRRSTPESWVGTHFELGAYQLVLVESAELIAFAGKNRIVLSSAMTDALSDQELEMLVKHELAHLDSSDDKTLTWAAAARGALGWIRPVANSLILLQFVLERAADERAAAGDPYKREVLARALERVIVSPSEPRYAGFAEKDLVGRRIEALRSPDVPEPGSAFTPVVAGGVALTAFLALATVAASFGTLGPCITG